MIDVQYNKKIINFNKTIDIPWVREHSELQMGKILVVVCSGVRPFVD
jgi:hypothetical protein